MAKRNRSTFERLQRGEMLSRRERKQIERQLCSQFFTIGVSTLRSFAPFQNAPSANFGAPADNRLEPCRVTSWGKWEN